MDGKCSSSAVPLKPPASSRYAGFTGTYLRIRQTGLEARLTGVITDRRLCYTSRITGMIRGRRDVCLEM